MTKQEKALRKVDVPLYNYLQALVLSFFSNRLYVDVGKRWKGFGILYLLFVTCLLAIPFAVRINLEFNNFFEEQIINPLKQIPPLYIQNGKVSLDKPMPYLIKNKKGEVVTIIDTTGEINAIDDRYPDLTTLITKDKFFYRVPPPHFFFAKGVQPIKNPVYSQTLSESINQVFDGEAWIKSSGIERIKWLSQVIVYPTIALLFFVIFLILFLVFALMGQFVAKLFFNLTISYKQTCRLLMVAATPQIVVLLLGLTFNLLFPGFGLLLLVLLFGYFCFAVISLKRESQKLVVS
ncbi:Protein of uncharacterised function (DUF1189) [Legionella lansingensis]|uniref:DUF1189 domain-containing protein n=1 Tax=Legionella lansingensis TaxID=45067 RepID=A0A0W0VHJ8_9GAMM|nr:DUF1189 family protein [Legionella lansingensis]KTD19302.1 hypothetical protein Llan_2154 [Legionella lansingensis]SNV50457.1 Protein of uncharacterised function (DUF1189) [Legionella lansingensis]